MNRRFLNLVVIVSIVSLVMLSSCSKDDDPAPELPNYSQDKGEFTDARDSKIYKWVKIGNQIWMAENLNYTGSGIQQITDDDEWANNSDGDGWCYNENNESYSNTYGVLYQWEAAKKACPSGWHLPTDAEWTQLENYLIDNGYSYDGVVGSTGIAKSLATDNGWEISDKSGAIGNSDFPEFRNKTGFSAFPSGYRIYYGYFNNLGYYGYWWCATEIDTNSVHRRQLYYDNIEVNRNDGTDKLNGFSVRCVKD
ncbi:FISUMP domain-containing protein [Lutibacter sp.]